jgi:hypothetical protein
MENKLLLKRIKEFFVKNEFTIILFVVVLFFSTSVYGATFKGKVIDADTKEPIEGAVVVASWLEERADIAGSTSELKDVKETLTDKNGEWMIKGPRGRDMGNITASLLIPRKWGQVLKYKHL